MKYFLLRTPCALVLSIAANIVVSGLSAAQLDLQVGPAIKVTGDIGSTLQIQYVTDLNSTNPWIVLTNILLSTSPALFLDSTANAQDRRFYRVVVLASATAEVPANVPINFVWIPPGSFTLGSPPYEKHRQPDEGPQTQVTLTEGFWMSQYPVTQAQYQTVMGTNPSRFTGDLLRPVESVSWDDATNYCAKLTRLEQAAGRLPTGYAYRLPTEAEWECACRAGTSTRFSYGDDPSYAQLANYAWFNGNSHGITHRVGMKLANPWGLYDMHGNVYTWCLDWYAATYPGESVVDPQGPSVGIYRVYRGDGWLSGGDFSRSAARGSNPPDFRDADIGIRPVLAPAR